MQFKIILESHFFVVDKHTSEIKARIVMGGNKQQDFISKEDASLTTVATKLVLLSCVIGAKEGGDVTMIDIWNVLV